MIDVSSTPVLGIYSEVFMSKFPLKPNNGSSKQRVGGVDAHSSDCGRPSTPPLLKEKS